MAERIPTEEVERLVAAGEVMPIVNAIGVDAHLRLRHQRRDLAADLLDARQRIKRLEWLIEAATSALSGGKHYDAEEILRGALSGEETR